MGEPSSSSFLDRLTARQPEPSSMMSMIPGAYAKAARIEIVGEYYDASMRL
jgi:hypothetical protein